MGQGSVTKISDNIFIWKVCLAITFCLEKHLYFLNLEAIFRQAKAYILGFYDFKGVNNLDCLEVSKT